MTSDRADSMPVRSNLGTNWSTGLHGGRTTALIVSMFSESESDDSDPNQHDVGTQPDASTQQIAGGSVAAQAAGGLAAAQAAEDLKSWVPHTWPMTDTARTKMGRQARPLVVMSMCSGMGTHIAAMKVGRHRWRPREYRPDLVPGRIRSDRQIIWSVADTRSTPSSRRPVETGPIEARHHLCNMCETNMHCTHR